MRKPTSTLEPLEQLRDRVKAFADICEPDHDCEMPRVRDELRFTVIDLDEHPSGLSGEEISLQILGTDHLFTEWSRAQMLVYLGTREKWFEKVTLEEQAFELTRRIHKFDRQTFRRYRSHDDINYVRGLVSRGFTDIPDLDVVHALCEAVPDGEVLRDYSGLSDRAFYAYTITRSTVLGLGKTAWGHPGAIVKNSEVGATALAVVPFFLVVHENGLERPVALRRQALMRKVHRGQYNDLKAALAQAMTQLQATWGPLQTRLDGLVALRFPGEQEALDRLHDALTRMRASKRFIERCSTTYRAAKNTAHNGLSLLTSVLAACATNELDSRYDDAEVAGYLLLQLL